MRGRTSLRSQVMVDVVSLDDPAAAHERAVDALRDGEVVVVPGDTAYAVVADAFQPEATRELARAKRRSAVVAVPVLIRSPRQVTGLVAEVPEAAERLMASYWPGPVTLVFQAVEGLTWDLGQSRGTVALRIPTDDFTLGLIGEVGPLAATAANRRGQPPPGDVAGAREQLGDAVALYVDGGPRTATVSTIVDVTGDRAGILREGVVAAEDVEAVATGRVPWGGRPGAEGPEAGSRADTGAAVSDQPPTTDGGDG